MSNLLDIHYGLPVYLPQKAALDISVSAEVNK